MLADSAGLAVGNGVLVNAFLRTGADGVYAAGDIAAYPDPLGGAPIRIEHWVTSERQGQAAAANMLGQERKFDAVPFFWSQHYDVTINYVGHAERWDRIDVDGSLDERNCAVTYKGDGRTRAVATISRDLVSLEAEAAMEALE